MKINLNLGRESLPVVTSPSNMVFHHVDRNKVFFHLHRFPDKKIGEMVSAHECRQIDRLPCFVVFVIRKDSTTVHLQYRYFTRKYERAKGNEKQRVLLTEKEHRFPIECSKDEIENLLDPFRNLIGTTELGWLDHWLHPISLDDVAAILTPAQKVEAVQLLMKHFGLRFDR